MSLQRIDGASFQNAIKQNGATLVEFGASWCPPCKALIPILEELSQEEAGRLDVYQVDCDESPDLAAQFGIMSMPTVIIFYNGEPKDKLIGLRPKSAYQAALTRYAS